MAYGIQSTSISIACWVAWNITTGPAIGDSPSSAEEVRKAIAARQTLIHSIYVVYEGHGYNDSFPQGTYVHKELYAQAPSSFYHLSAHGFQGLRWQDDPLLQETRVLPTGWSTFLPFNTAYFGEPCTGTDPLPGTLGEDFFLQTTGFWPEMERQAPRTGGFMIAVIDIATSSDYVLRPQLEEVDGHLCHVLENPNMDILWLDEKRGWALVQRASFDNSSGAPLDRIENGDFREVAPGVWIPFSLKCTHYDTYAHSEADQTRIVHVSAATVLTARINEDHSDLLTWDVPAGAIELDAGESGGYEQVTAHGLDHLDRLAAWCRQHIEYPRPNHANVSYVPQLLTMIVGICLLELTLGIRRRFIASHKAP